MATYKQSRLAAVDAQIRDIITDTLSQVLGKSLSLEEHTELIVQALEQAKKQNANRS